MIETLREGIVEWRGEGFTIERESRVVRGIVLCGEESRNGYRYREEALREAIPLYDGKPAFLDHGNPARPYERSTRDLVGTVCDVRFEGGRLVGSLRVLETDAGQTFLGLAEGDSPAVGMSHVVLAERSGDGTIVERIRDVISVDAVIFPATTKGLWGEGLHSAEDRVVELDPDRDALQQELEQLRTERNALLGRCAEASDSRDRLAERLREIDLKRELVAAGLPAVAWTDRFLTELAQVNDAARGELIRERRDLCERISRVKPHSAARGEPQQEWREAFLRALRG